MCFLSPAAKMLSSRSIFGVSSASVDPTSYPPGAARPTPNVKSWPYFGGVQGRSGSSEACSGFRYLSVATATTFGGATGSGVKPMGNDPARKSAAAVLAVWPARDRPARQQPGRIGILPHDQTPTPLRRPDEPEHRHGPPY